MWNAMRRDLKREIRDDSNFNRVDREFINIRMYRKMNVR